MQKRDILRLLITLLSVTGAVGGCAAAVVPGPGTTVFLVRHAEPTYPPPAAAPKDPPLNNAGRERAEQLAHALGDAGIGLVLSTEYRRAWETAAPLAEHLDLEIEAYDPDELAALAARLRSTPGRILVSGHSNTTPELVGLLGGDPGTPIDHTVEFDRLYVVNLEPGRPVRTVLLRYGEPPMAAGLAESTACLDDPVSMELEGADLRDVARSFESMLTCVAVELDAGLAGRVSVRLEEVAFRDALSAICESAGCAWQLEPGTPPRLRFSPTP